MAERIPIPFVGPSYDARSPRVASNRTINLYPQVESLGAKGNIVLYSDPGLRPVGVLGVGPCRSNGLQFQGKLYFISGNELVSLDNDLNEASYGTISTNGGRVVMDATRTRVVIVDGTQGYTFDGTTLGAIADSDFPDTATHVVVIDDTFIVNDAVNPDRFWRSTDGLAWSATDFATAESSPDALIAVGKYSKDLYLAGSQTTEIWTNTGASPFPFERLAGGVVPWGVVAPYSFAQSSLGLFWLAGSKEGEVDIIHVAGLTPTRISESWIDWRISQMSRVDDAFGHVYQQAGRWYYQLTFPTGGATFVYNVNEKLWHERKSWDSNRHRVAGHGFIDRHHIVGDYVTGQFYELDFACYTDNDEPMERLRRSQVIHKSGNRLTFHELVVEFETGVGLEALGEGHDPVALLRYSDDGGRTWSYWLESPIGAIGEYGLMGAVWNRLGTARERVYEVKVVDPVSVTILNAYSIVDVNNG